MNQHNPLQNKFLFIKTIQNLQITYVCLKAPIMYLLKSTSVASYVVSDIFCFSHHFQVTTEPIELLRIAHC